MGQSELGGYLLLGAYGLLLVRAFRIFGARRVIRFFLAIAFVGVWLALGTLRGLTERRY